MILNIYTDFIEALGEEYCKYRFLNHIESDTIEKSIIKNMLSVYSSTVRSDNLNKINDNLKEIIDSFINHYVNVEKTTSNLEEKKRYLIKTQDLIINRDIKNLNLKYLSNTLNLSPSYISKLFNELSGIKFTEYIQQLKLSCAATYLLKTTYSIEKIAILVGFESTKSINRIFKRYLNMSPSHYREVYAYENNEVDQFEKFKNFIKRVEIEEYSEFINLYARNRELEHTIDLKKESKNENVKEIFKDWQVIRNLKSLGSDYQQGFKEIINKSEIREIVLKFYYDRGIDAFRLSDLGEVVDIADIYSILSSCIEYDITGSIALDLGEINQEKDIDLQIENNIYEFERFYDLISSVIGTTNMKKFRYSLEIKDIIKFKDDSVNLLKYQNYIARMQRYLERKLGISDFEFGFNLGTVNKKILMSLIKFIMTLWIKKQDIDLSHLI